MPFASISSTSAFLVKLQAHEAAQLAVSARLLIPTGVHLCIVVLSGTCKKSKRKTVFSACAQHWTFFHNWTPGESREGGPEALGCGLALKQTMSGQSSFKAVTRITYGASGQHESALQQPPCHKATSVLPTTTAQHRPGGGLS